MTALDYVKSVNKSNEAEGDYRKGGILYCGTCHEPKQRKGEDISPFASGAMLSIPCRCVRERQAAEEKEKHWEKIEGLRKVCLPRSNQRASRFETAESSRAIQIAKKYVDNWETMKTKGAGLMFYGDVGTGKSFAAQCIANALIEREIPVQYISAADILAEFTAKDTDQDAYLKKITKIPLLIIDDLGAEYSTDYSQSQICRIIDARRESGRPLIITTNYTPTEFESTADKHKQRIFDRVLASCVPVEVVGGSRRKQERQKRLQEARELLMG